MALINYTSKEINAKIVYYGPGLSGKTTNLQHIYEKIAPEHKGKLISLPTYKDRTLFFDFFPVEVGTIRSFKVNFHLYTVPGQVFYNATRKLVLKGADGVVFVADSQKIMMESNIQSLENLGANLADQGVDLYNFPFVLQYNKMDLPDVSAIGELNEKLNPRMIPYFEASALRGKGVLETLTAISKFVLEELKRAPEKHNISYKELHAGDGAEKRGRITEAGEVQQEQVVVDVPADRQKTGVSVNGSAAPRDLTIEISLKIKMSEDKGGLRVKGIEVLENKMKEEE